MASKALTIRDRSRDGLLEISDTRVSTDHLTLYVTVREIVGVRLLDARTITAMRRLAKRALPGAQSSRTLRCWYAQGQCHATFSVSLLDRAPRH